MLLIYGAAVACLAVPTARAQGGGTEPGQSYHRDLGYPVPDWTQFQRSEANESAIEPLNSATQHWGSIAPHDESDAPLCKWFSGGEHGSCKTDVSWLHAAVGIKKSFFQSALANYILRFHAYGACYRSTVYSYNDVAQYCASWWYDPGKAKKVPVIDICYPLEWRSQTETDEDGEPVVYKQGCLHQAPAPAARRLREVAGGAEAPSDIVLEAARFAASRRLRAGEADAPAPGDAPEPPPTAPVYDELEDLIATNTVYNANGQEFNEVRQAWYACRDFTVFGTPARERCYDEAFGVAFGIDAFTIKQLLQIVQNETRGQEDVMFWGGARCSAHFEESVRRKPDGTSDREWCERDQSEYIVANRLGPQLGFMGTPAQPRSAEAVVTPPPPPPSPPPPSPPSPPPLAGGVTFTATFSPQREAQNAAAMAAQGNGGAAAAWQRGVAALGAAAALAMLL